MEALLAIDIGSTSIKAIVYDAAGNRLAGGSRPTERVHPAPDHPEWTVWEPEQIWQAVCSATGEALAGLDPRRRPCATAVTGMGMDGLPVDEEGQALYPFISWLDGRTAGQLAWALEHVGAERTFAISGAPLWPIHAAARIRWMMEHQPAILARAAKWLFIEDYVNARLCGRMATDYSMASCSALFDQRRLAWSDELVAAWQIDHRLLPDPLPAATPLGAVTAAASRQTGIAAGTPVVLGGHDHLCGCLPVGAFVPGVALDVTGTWESVIASTAAPVLDPSLAAAGMTVQSHVARGRYAVWGGAVAGEMVEWCRRQLATPQADDWTAMAAAAAARPPGAGGVLFLPHLAGGGSPVVDPRSRGAWVGLGNNSTAGDLLRAVFEGLCYQFRHIAEALEKGIARPLDRFVAVGGATRNPLWMQMKADVLGRPVEVATVEEATPLGAAILAGIGVGVYADEADACRRVGHPGTVYRPDARTAELYERGFSIYCRLYPALAAIHHQLGQTP